MLECFNCDLKTVYFGCYSILCMLGSDHVDNVVTIMLVRFYFGMTIRIFCLA